MTLLCTLALVAFAAPSAIREVKPAVFPPYDSYKGIARYAPTPVDYAAAIADRRFVMERVTYRCDDLNVHAYLYRPATPPKDSKLPVVVFMRGSYVRDDFSLFLYGESRGGIMCLLGEAEIVEARSALRWPEKIGIPLLIMNGADDTGVSPTHARELAAAPEKLGRPYEPKIFHGEKHVLSGRAAERDQDAMRWFRRFER
jgi:dipeptidyl aminopeptidase/acylaminoacyl peptidase